jgi:hypothetical protein
MAKMPLKALLLGSPSLSSSLLHCSFHPTLHFRHPKLSNFKPLLDCQKETPKNDKNRTFQLNNFIKDDVSFSD